MIAFIDDHRDAYGLEPICRVLPIAPSTYHERVAQRQNPSRLLVRAGEDSILKLKIDRVFTENFTPQGLWQSLGGSYRSPPFRHFISVINKSQFCSEREITNTGLYFLV